MKNLNFEHILMGFCPILNVRRCISGYIVRPNEASFIVANYILLIFNMCLHCEQLTHIRWLPGLVTPLQHHQHHKNRTKHYSGPIIDYDWLITQT